MRRANEARVGLVVLRRVIDKAAAPAKECIVLDARLESVVLVRRFLVHSRSPWRTASHTEQSRVRNGLTRYSGTIAVASISSRAFFSSSPATCTTAIAG